MNLSLSQCFRTSILLCVILLSACSTTPKDEGVNDPRDPLEVINRPFWTFTWDYVDKYVAKPASEYYTSYTPQFLRTGLYNMALNLDEPSSAINNLLQLKFSDAAKGTGRFLLNSTIGLLGFYDPASDFGWTGQKEEFGEVLGSYGLGDGPYLVLQVLVLAPALRVLALIEILAYFLLLTVQILPKISSLLQKFVLDFLRLN